jgi:hypothetical protein
MKLNKESKNKEKKESKSNNKWWNQWEILLKKVKDLPKNNGWNLED